MSGDSARSELSRRKELQTVGQIRLEGTKAVASEDVCVSDASEDVCVTDAAGCCGYTESAVNE